MPVYEDNIFLVRKDVAYVEAEAKAIATGIDQAQSLWSKDTLRDKMCSLKQPSYFFFINKKLTDFKIIFFLPS